MKHFCLERSLNVTSNKIIPVSVFWELDFGGGRNDVQASCTIPPLLFTLLLNYKAPFFNVISHRKCFPLWATSFCQKVTDSSLSELRLPWPLSQNSEHPHTVSRWVLMEFTSECVFAFALSGSGPWKGSHRLWNSERRPSWTFCAPADVRDHTRKTKVKHSTFLCGDNCVSVKLKGALMMSFQYSSSSKVFA